MSLLDIWNKLTELISSFWYWLINVDLIPFIIGVAIFWAILWFILNFIIPLIDAFLEQENSRKSEPTFKNLLEQENSRKSEPQEPIWKCTCGTVNKISVNNCKQCGHYKITESKWS